MIKGEFIHPGRRAEEMRSVLFYCAARCFFSSGLVACQQIL